MACCSPNGSTSPVLVAEPIVVPPGLVALPQAHIHLHTPHLADVVACYRACFGSNPVKLKPGYAKFLPCWSPVNLARSEHPAGSTGSAVSHLGLQLASPVAVRAHLQRVKAAGLPVREEMGVTCCHASQDKFWVTDPAGVEWEVYYLNFDVDGTVDATAVNSTCCPS